MNEKYTVNLRRSTVHKRYSVPLHTAGVCAFFHLMLR
jgi:hypothetical protein